MSRSDPHLALSVEHGRPSNVTNTISSIASTSITEIANQSDREPVNHCRLGVSEDSAVCGSRLPIDPISRAIFDGGEIVDLQLQDHFDLYIAFFLN